MKNYKNKKIYMFDWDGTIFDSMSLKKINFEHAFLNTFPENLILKSQSIKLLYENLSGFPRKKIFDEISAELLISPSPEDFILFNKSFEALNKGSLSKAKIFEDALLLLHSLAEKGYLLVISSSVPKQELVDIVNGALPSKIRERISSVLGSEDGFTKGVEHVEWVRDKYHASLDDIIMIGDDLADYSLALLAKVDSLIVTRGRNYTKFSEINSSHLIVDFKLLLDQINEI
jgi:phosphoglycolate phosphatase-like HAD superfamily hydrolase